ncbi:ATP-binding protein [Lichenicola sp.]|uniref:ATP-binding protein n=1 Tax=Lichenicola sp. TaxID=2804529 RepID=UPI003B003D72
MSQDVASQDVVGPDVASPDVETRPVETRDVDDGRVADETPCDREPVHLPGTVQPHGMLFVLQPGADAVDRLVAASSNAFDGPADPADARPVPVSRLDDLLAADALVRLERVLDELHAEDGVVLEQLATRDGRHWTGLIHKGASQVLLELEPEQVPDPSATRRILLSLNQAIEALRHAPDAASVCGIAARHLREITGFDRVMAYRFMPDWSGEVLAEAAGPGVGSYLGLVFPASDIPAAARALYASNRLRLIPDARARQVPLQAIGDGPAAGTIDLARAVLRGVAPVHLEYLGNMNVHASMSVAISIGAEPTSTPAGIGRAEPSAMAGRLWGLLACHHQHGPLAVDHMQRQAAETIAQALSWRLGELAEAEAGRRVAAVQLAQPEILAVLGLPDATTDRVPASGGTAGSTAEIDHGTMHGAAATALLDACGASGLAVLGSRDGDLLHDCLRVGAVPPAEALRRLVVWLDDARGTQSLVTDRLESLLPADLVQALGPDHPCGLMANPLAEASGRDVVPGHAAGQAPSGGWVLWFRPELRRQVSWAGYKSLTPDASGRLHPRASFAAWREEVAGRSAVWSEDCVAAARQFRDAVVASLLRRGALVAQEAALLRRRNEAISFFADAATHDLREPLWQVQVLSGLIRDGLQELFGSAVDPTAPADPIRQGIAREAADLELETMAGLVVTSAGRMRTMIDDLARFAVAGRDLDRLATVPLRRLVEEALEDVGAALREVPDAVLSLDGLGEECVACDPTQFRRVFQNLISNSIKYRDAARPLRVEVTARRSGRMVQVDFDDNGIGFEPADCEAIFEPFRRLGRSALNTEEGLGLGLAICQRIVEAHGGTIDATPLVPGARFSFVLHDRDSPSLAHPEEHADA